jgi:hypothetical protein
MRLINIFIFFSILFLLIPITVTADDSAKFKDMLYDEYQLEFFGFLETRQGSRLKADPYEEGSSISELRVQVDMTREFSQGLLKFKGDLGGDLVEDDRIAEIREFNFAFSPTDNIDMKAGRQVITWGTGDLLFINDLFSKDWKSFFIGRDDEYLKAPSDALKTGFFSDLVNLDFVWVPYFNGSEYIDGSRISYWNSALGRTAGQDFIFKDHKRNSFSQDSEYSLRLAKNISSLEFAFYLYKGFWKTPEGMNPFSMKLIYPELGVYGFSVRGTISGGIGNLELGYYDSKDDNNGSNAMIRNSEIRLLGGFEREIGQDLTGGFQYYLEYMQDFDQYKQNLPAGMAQKDELRHLLTIRLTKLLFDQNLRASLFCYYSPSDKDTYIRPKLHYKFNDQIAIDLGANIFGGKEPHTFFGQFENNSNIYAGMRYNF